MNQQQKLSPKKPTFYKSELVKMELELSMRSDRLGNLFYYVHYGENEYSRFERLESALDFIHSNF